MFDQLADAWLVNHRVMLRLLDGLTPEALAATLSTRGGRTVGQQLVHVYEVRRAHLESADRELAKGLPKVARERGDDLPLLRDVFERSGEAIAEAIRKSAATDGKGKGFRRGAAALVTYLVAHDAHHRGHLLLTMKQCGVRRPKDLQMGLWDWNKV